VDDSSTYNPPTPAARINGGVFSPLLSKGWDSGLRFTFLENKLVFSVTQYESKQTNVALPTGTQSLPVAVPGVLNSIIQLTPLGDTNPNDINKEGLAPVPAVYSDTATAEARGTELELTANPMRGWRMLANIAFPKAAQSNAFADSRAYIAANTSAFIKILNDGGIVLNNNVAAVNPAVPANQFASQPNAAAAANAWNSLQTLNANFVTGAQMLTRLSKYTANLFSDYTIQSGGFKGVLFGAGVHYYGPQVIGFHGADTIVNPNNPAAAIPDPNANPYNPVYQSAYALYTGVLGYTWKLDHHTVRLTLNIDNALGYNQPIYYDVGQQPPGGNLSSPARVATPLHYFYVTPTSYSLSATVKF
jgi:hypothetical protein